LIPKVSVIIPTWNRALLLPRAIESVLTQTFADWELIIVDDGSRDGTENVCNRFGADPRVRYHRTENQGVSAARNCGIELARSDWLAFLDSDDVWLPAKLERQFEMIGATGDRICHTDEIWIRRGRRVNPMKKHQKHGGWIFLQCLPLCVVSPSSSLVHRSVLERVGVFDTAFTVCEDYEFWLRVTSRFPVSLVNDRLITKFGGHADQLSRKFWGMDRWRVKALHARLPDQDLRPEWRREMLVELLHKTEILIQGYENNQRVPETEELKDFLARMRRWGKALADDPARGEPLPELPASIDQPSLKE
jgi:glycosyltransferase involved in cell wall biosynthesis